MCSDTLEARLCCKSGCWAQGWRLTCILMAGIGAFSALIAFPGIWEPRMAAAAAGPAAAGAERTRVKKHWPTWAEAKKFFRKVCMDIWLVLKVRASPASNEELASGIRQKPAACWSHAGTNEVSGSKLAAMLLQAAGNELR